MGLTTPEMITHTNALIQLYRDLSKNERERKRLHSSRISVSREARDICNTASIRIKAFDDFIAHLQGCVNLMRGGVVSNFAHELNKEPHTEALNKHNVSGSVCLHCGFDREKHSILALCPDRMNTFEAN